MSEDKNHIEPLKELSVELMQAYAAGTLSPAQQYQVEKYLLDNPFEAEAMEGYLVQANAFEDLPLLHQKLQERISASVQNTKTVPFWRQALPYAAVFSLLVVATIIATVIIGQQEDIRPISLQKEDALPAQEHSLKPITPPSATEEQTTEVEKVEKEQSLELAVAAPRKKEKTLSALTKDDPEIIFEESADSFTTEAIQQIPEETKKKVSNANEEIALQLQGRASGVKITESDTMKETQTLTSYAASKSSLKKTEVTQKSISENKVSGKVTDAETGEALPGVNVMVKNSTVGVTTDLEGNFQIEAAPDDVLVVSFIGMEREEVKVSTRSEIDVALHSDVAQLSEVVVVSGYGTEEDTDVSYQSSYPVGGFSAFKDYINENLRYPDKALANKTEGKVVLKVTISATGQLKNFDVLKSLGEDFDEEAIRLIKEGPSWEPAKRGEQPVESTRKIRIKFKL